VPQMHAEQGEKLHRDVLRLVSEFSVSRFQLSAMRVSA